MTNERFFDRERLLKKKIKDKKEKSTSFHSYQSQKRLYDLGGFLSDVGNQEIQNFFESGLIQAKLNVSQSGDIYEQEAERIANSIVNATDTSRKAKINHKKPRAGTKNISVNSNSESRIKKLKGKGNPLNKSVREYFEPRFGVDLGNVRIHTGGNELNKLANSINAKAFTHGKDIVFDKGQYQPETVEGKKLIAHELTHTIQQDKEIKDKIINNKGDKNDSKEKNILAKLGKGQSLPSYIQSKMGSLFGASFSDVRIHTDNKAGQMANELNAKAFTIGNHIVFNNNEYKPGTLIGDALIAHELAHTIQQKSANKNEMVKSLSENTFRDIELEKDADASTISIISKMFGKVKSGFMQAMPRLKTGLTVSRCAQETLDSYMEKYKKLSTTREKIEYLSPLKEEGKLEEILSDYTYEQRMQYRNEYIEMFNFLKFDNLQYELSLSDPNFWANAKDGFFIDSNIETYLCLMPKNSSMDPIIRTQEELFEDTVNRESSNYDIIINGNMYTVTDAGLWDAAVGHDPIPAEETIPDGYIISKGKLVSGSDANQMFYLAYNSSNSSNPYEFGFGNPPSNSTSAIGDLGPLIINGLKYGIENLYSQGVPEGAPQIGEPDAKYKPYLIQRSNLTFSSFMNKKDPYGNCGKTIVACNSTRSKLLILVQPDGKNGLRLDNLRDKLYDLGFNNAVFLDGSNSAMLVVNGDIWSRQQEDKDETNIIGLGFNY